MHNLSEKSRIAFGITYDSSPVKDEFRTFDMPLDETVNLSATYGWEHSDTLFFSIGTTLYFVGSAPLSQTGQGVTVTGDYDTNMFAIVGGSLRYEF